MDYYFLPQCLSPVREVFFFFLNRVYIKISGLGILMGVGGRKGIWGKRWGQTFSITFDIYPGPTEFLKF